MRHFVSAHPVAVLALGMGKAATTAALVTPSGGLHRLAPGLL